MKAHLCRTCRDGTGTADKDVQASKSVFGFCFFDRIQQLLQFIGLPAILGEGSPLKRTLFAADFPQHLHFTGFFGLTQTVCNF